MAPSPITARVFPWISWPAKFFLPFSTKADTSSPFPINDFPHVTASVISRDASSKPASTSSFTPLALAPGVLNTTIPFSVHLSIGILLTPAPARATAFREPDSSISCILKLRKTIASGLGISLAISYLSNGNKLSPSGSILFNVWILNIGFYFIDEF